MHDETLRQQLVWLLRSKYAHANFDTAIGGLPPEVRGQKPPGAEHTPWEVLEHLRIAQWDMLEFSRDPNHVSPEFPAGYWPETESPPSDAAWERSVAAFRHDLEEMVALVENPATDLFARIPHGEGQTILREALLLADHNAYHLGELVLLRRLLGAWPRRG